LVFAWSALTTLTFSAVAARRRHVVTVWWFELEAALPAVAVASPAPHRREKPDADRVA
jgi:hypothetical protein